MNSKNSSLIPQIIKRSKVLSTAINNPITFLLGRLHTPAKLVGVFTLPIPVSFRLRRSLIAGAELIALIALIVAGSIVGVDHRINPRMWLLGRFFPTHKPRASAPETPLKKNKSV